MCVCGERARECVCVCLWCERVCECVFLNAKRSTAYQTETPPPDGTIAFERRGSTFKGLKGLLLERQGQDLALTVLHVPDSLSSGSVTRNTQQRTRQRSRPRWGPNPEIVWVCVWCERVRESVWCVCEREGECLCVCICVCGVCV